MFPFTRIPVWVHISDPPPVGFLFLANPLGRGSPKLPGPGHRRGRGVPDAAGEREPGTGDHEGRFDSIRFECQGLWVFLCGEATKLAVSV